MELFFGSDQHRLGLLVLWTPNEVVVRVNAFAFLKGSKEMPESPKFVIDLDRMERALSQSEAKAFLYGVAVSKIDSGTRLALEAEKVSFLNSCSQLFPEDYSAAQPFDAGAGTWAALYMNYQKFFDSVKKETENSDLKLLLETAERNVNRYRHTYGG